MPRVLFVSVNRSFQRDFTLPQLEPWVEQAWATSVEKASTCDRVVAVYEGQPVAAWRVRGAYAHASRTFKVASGDLRPRVGLSLGDALPLLPEYANAVPPLRRGVADVFVDVDSLPSERVEVAALIVGED
jgi:hypothetical protein